MERYNKIIEHQTFIHYLNEIEEIEKDRIYCRHNLVHLLDVARIAYIKNLEAGSPFSKDMIYGAALLHDIGKVEQYKEKIPHEITGAKKAVDILADCGYDDIEMELIGTAILDHRHGPERKERRLSVFLYEADKQSRACYHCPAKESCKWPEKTKNKNAAY